MRMTTRNILNFYHITMIDYSSYNVKTCRNGGDYAFGDTLINNGDGSFTRIPYTSGEFCPKCGSWDCCGDCCENAVISPFSALLLFSSALNRDYDILIF